MSPPILPLVTAKTAAEICSKCALPDEVRPLLTPALTPLEFLDRVLADETAQPHAVGFLAHALPKRVAVFWGCLCLEMVAGPKLKPPDAAALQAAFRWVLDPREENRRPAGAAAAKTDPNGPAGNLAQAVFESGGSYLGPDQPVVEPPPTLTAEGVSAAVHLTVAMGEMDELLPLYRRCLAIGIQLARGFASLPEAGKARPQAAPRSA